MSRHKRSHSTNSNTKGSTPPHQTSIHQSSSPRQTKKQSSIFLRSVLLMVIIFVVSATIIKLTDLFLYKNHYPKQLPELNLTLSDVTIEEIDLNDKSIRYPGNILTLTSDGSTTIFHNIEVKGHGNSTWGKPKKPYQVKFADKVSLFDYNKAKKWLLLANSIDPTYLRNDIAFYLEKVLNEPYPINGNFLELYIDDSYCGLYYLTEKAELDKSRIHLQNPSAIMMELDNIHGEADNCYYDQYNNCFIIRDAINDDTAPTVAKSFINSLNRLENAITSRDFAKVSSIVDIDSFARYYLLNEFTVNPDAYSASFFLYQDGQDDKIHAGPGWDFDFALGNLAWGAGGIDYEIFYSPDSDTVLKEYAAPFNTSSLDPDNSHIASIYPFVYDLLDFPEFITRVKEIYSSTLSGHGEELLDYIRSEASYIRDAAYRDEARWKLTTDFDEEVDYLIDWVAKRYAHFESTYGLEL